MVELMQPPDTQQQEKKYVDLFCGCPLECILHHIFVKFLFGAGGERNFVGHLFLLYSATILLAGNYFMYGI